MSSNSGDTSCDENEGEEESIMPTGYDDADCDPYR